MFEGFQTLMDSKHVIDAKAFDLEEQKKEASLEETHIQKFVI